MAVRAARQTQGVRQNVEEVLIDAFQTAGNAHECSPGTKEQREGPQRKSHRWSD